MEEQRVIKEKQGKLLEEKKKPSNTKIKKLLL